MRREVGRVAFEHHPVHATHEPEGERGSGGVTFVTTQHVEARTLLLDIDGGVIEEDAVEGRAADCALLRLESEEAGQVVQRRPRDGAAPQRDQKMA